MKSLIPENFNKENVKKHIEIEELNLYAVNTSELYRRYFYPIQKNLYKKYLNGTYNPLLAQKNILNIIKEIEKHYIKEFCTHDFKFNFNADEKKALANEILKHYTADFFEYQKMGWKKMEGKKMNIKIRNNLMQWKEVDKEGLENFVLRKLQDSPAIPNQDKINHINERIEGSTCEEVLRKHDLLKYYTITYFKMEE